MKPNYRSNGKSYADRADAGLLMHRGTVVEIRKQLVLSMFPLFITMNKPKVGSSTQAVQIKEE
jgi:hypothetical protein